MAILNDRHTDPEVAQELDDKVVPKGLGKLDMVIAFGDYCDMKDRETFRGDD